ncbi:MAG: flagellar protein FlgN [Syntrophomonas sp.]
MEKLIPDFIQMLKKENSILDMLVEIAEEKKNLIILGKVQELDNLIKKEGITISNLDRIEGARFKLQEKMAAEFDLTPQEFKASEMLKRTRDKSPETYKELEEQISRLDYNVVRLKAINTHNNELVDQSLDFIGAMESMLNGDVAGTYSQKGLQSDESKSRPKISLLDKKI